MTERINAVVRFIKNHDPRQERARIREVQKLVTGNSDILDNKIKSMRLREYYAVAAGIVLGFASQGHPHQELLAIEAAIIVPLSLVTFAMNRMADNDLDRIIHYYSAGPKLPR